MPCIFFSLNHSSKPLFLGHFAQQNHEFLSCSSHDLKSLCKFQKICIKYCDTILDKIWTIFTTVHFANFFAPQTTWRVRNFSAQVGNKPKKNSNGSQRNQQSATNCRQYEKNSTNRQACCNRKKTPKMQIQCKKLSNLPAQSQTSQKGKIVFFGYMSEKNVSPYHNWGTIVSQMNHN